MLLRVYYSTDVVIGFLSSSYNVSEGDGFVNIQIGVVNGSIETRVVVSFFIIDHIQSSGGKPGI